MPFTQAQGSPKMTLTIWQGQLIELGGGTTTHRAAVESLERMGLVKIVEQWREGNQHKFAYVLTPYGKNTRAKMFTSKKPVLETETK
jgi:hypothetical protein